MNRLCIGLLVLLSVLECKASKVSVVSEVYQPNEKERSTWEELRRKGVNEIIFVKRFTYNADHYYSEFINSSWKPGGSLSVLSLETGEVEDLVPSLSTGIYGSFDLSFDAKRVVFSYKASKNVGYRIYEVSIDGTNLKQLTFSPKDEAEIVKKYSTRNYHGGTEDLDPCYLPDGGIAFISTRCKYSTLCHGGDLFTTTVMYRMDHDGSNMQQLSNSALSENTPCMLSDGRIMYTRWEYVDKGAVVVKCLWSMFPDGTNSTEIYGNNIDFPTTMIMGRPIPGVSNEYVFTGVPHYPQNGVGTIVRIDVSKGTRTKEAMTYMTPQVDIQAEGGFAFRDPKDHTKWIRDRAGKGPLFRESFPLSRSAFIVSHKPTGPTWNDPIAYQLYLLKEGGDVRPIYKDNSISCFRPIVVAPRETPPILSSRFDEGLAAKGLAECIVTNVYEGLEGVNKGEVKYLRVLEQVPRPWGARRFYRNLYDDHYDQQHVVITKDTHLGLKVQHGVVTVEEDGSARFLVPANRNIFLQALDANYMALQTERTYVNYMPGEVRSCVGCHETNTQAPRISTQKTPIALKRKGEIPYAQKGEEKALRTLSYARDVQPVFDKHCISCHNSSSSPAKLNLSGKETRLFNESYESLLPERRKKRYDRAVLGPVIGENHPKTGNIVYLPAKSLGSHASILVAMLSKGKVKLSDPKSNTRVQYLAQKHKKINLTDKELLKITNWIDTNCQYYGSYYGRRSIKYKNHIDYRTEYDVDIAIQKHAPVPYKE